MSEPITMDTNQFWIRLVKLEQGLNLNRLTCEVLELIASRIWKEGKQGQTVRLDLHSPLTARQMREEKGWSRSHLALTIQRMLQEKILVPTKGSGRDCGFGFHPEFISKLAGLTKRVEQGSL